VTHSQAAILSRAGPRVRSALIMSDKGSSAPPGDGEVANKATVDVSCEEEKAVTPAGAPTGAGAGAGGVGAGAGAGAGMGASAETGPPEAGSTLSTGLFYDARMCLHECPSGDHPGAWPAVGV